MSESGGLDMQFTRPVIVPPLFRGKGLASIPPNRRSLADDAVDEALKEMLEVKINSGFFDSDSSQLAYDTLQLMKFTPTEFAIQLTFKNTATISQSAAEPDIAEVRIKRTDLFIDAETYEVLEPNFVMYVRIPPQVTLEEASLLSLADTISYYVALAFTGALLAGNLLVGHGKMYQWNFIGAC